MNPSHGAQRAAQCFQTVFHTSAKLLAQAPGRVNLIGEHTDYNEGFVFPCAIDRWVHAAIGSKQNASEQVRVYSLDYEQLDTFDLRNFGRSEKFPWSNYVRGVLYAIKKSVKSDLLTGFDLVLSGNVPQGAGLSSSAAFELALGTALNEHYNLGLSGKELAFVGQRAENEFVGVNCGIMDQLISALGVADSALFIDCRSYEVAPIPLNLEERSMKLVITNSGVKRGLVESEYNARRRECEEASHSLNKLSNRSIKSLRDVDLAIFEKYASVLPELPRQRAKHVITENQRVLQAIEAIKDGQMNRFGQLLYASHESLRDDFQVSCPELDLLVELTKQHNGVLGSRMTGAGFGGCTVSLMSDEAATSFEEIVISQYEKSTSQKAEVHICQATDGAGLVQG